MLPHWTSTKHLHIRQFALHALNVAMQSCDHVPAVESIWLQSKQILTYFRSNTSVQEKLPRAAGAAYWTLKLGNEVPTPWQSTYQMATRLNDEEEPVLQQQRYSNYRRLMSLTLVGVVWGEDCFGVRGHLFDEAATVILHFNVTVQLCTDWQQYASTNTWGDQSNRESLSVLILSTLLISRFKSLAFQRSFKRNDTVNRLKLECAALIGRTLTELKPGLSEQLAATHSPWLALSGKLW